MEQRIRTADDAVDEQHSADADCVRRTLAGDLGAFDELVSRYQRRIAGVAYRLLGNSHDAADVAQDVFLRAYRALGTLTEPERFGAWLTRIACNLSLNFRRGRRSGLSLVTDDGSDEAAGPAQTGTVDHDPIATSEAKAAIDAAIAKLPEKQRLSLILFAIEGLPHKDVADILDCSVEAVKWNVFQARKKLKDDLAEYLIDE